MLPRICYPPTPLTGLSYGEQSLCRLPPSPVHPHEGAPIHNYCNLFIFEAKSLICLEQISRVKHCLDRTSLLTAINALVFSKLYYCSNVWANTTEKNIRKLQAVQNFACRIVSGARKYDHVTPHLKVCLGYPLRTNYTIAKLSWLLNAFPDTPPNIFITREQVTKRTTRSSQKLNIPLFKAASGQRTFYYKTIGLWNNLDPFLKSSRSVQVFKRILKHKLLDNFVNTS